MHEFGTFLENAEHEKGNLGYLTNFLKDVESLNIIGEVENNLKSRVVRGAKSRMSSGDPLPSRVLGLILSNENPKVTSLTISVYRRNDTLSHQFSHHRIEGLRNFMFMDTAGFPLT